MSSPAPSSGVQSPSTRERHRLYDAHNHLQDARFEGRQAELVSACQRVGIERMVTNGSCEEDWPEVAKLARDYPDLVLPSFGLHPWSVPQRTVNWQRVLLEYLGPALAAVGEIGLDRWKRDLPYDDQEEVFLWQLHIAAERNLPVSIHCLRAWGRLYELLRSHAVPARGFLLHSYGGSRELVRPFVRLGAHFSFPGAFAHERKSRQREAFRAVPLERLLIETDAPDQLPPGDNTRWALSDPGSGRPINHPANLSDTYAFVADMLRISLGALCAAVEANFACLFGGGANPDESGAPRPSLG